MNDQARPDESSRLRSYFDLMKSLSDQIHEYSHKLPEGTVIGAYEGAADVIGLYQALCDVLQWYSNSSSVHMRQLYNHDRLGLASEFENKILWRLERAASDDEAVRDPVDDGDGDAS